MRNILHVDMNAFYASCEQSRDKSLKGKPVLIAGDPSRRHGIVLTASYEARKYGIKTGMANWQASVLCPDAIFLKPDFDSYVQYSIKMINILKEFSPLVEQFSIDEAWVDVTGCEGLFGNPIDIAHKIQNRIKDTLDLPCSIGISENKLIAKMASELKKPMGITFLPIDKVKDVLWPLDIEELMWIGHARGKKLKSLGINTIGDLAHTPITFLSDLFGKCGRDIYYFANGIDLSPVKPYAIDAKSFGNTITLPRDYTDIEDIKRGMLSLSEMVGSRMRKQNFMGKTVSITVKDADFKTLTRSQTIDYTVLTEDIFDAAMKLFTENYGLRFKIRMLGVSISNLVKIDRDIQLSLFQNLRYEKLKKLNYAVDMIRDRYGFDSISRGLILSGERVKQIAPLSGMKNFDPRAHSYFEL
ncbi:DNA polymerase IV [Thermoanaerobacterium sp. RBIITD]|uniref:DNA polymerase IV n=1 Tax=Thermoanaerobacterium sp. RBIITD TaxID=1550240 RepID=UPI000BB6F676|nr:DNA polymerase IV [Thermoanaerobacterium sp. RBIITD]